MTSRSNGVPLSWSWNGVPAKFARLPKHSFCSRVRPVRGSLGDEKSSDVTDSDPGAGLRLNFDESVDGVADSGMEVLGLHATTDTAIAAATHRLIAAPVRPLEGLTGVASGHHSVRRTHHWQLALSVEGAYLGSLVTTGSLTLS